MEDLKIKSLVQRYSEFVSFPIKVWTKKTTYEQVEDDEAPEPEEVPPARVFACVRISIVAALCMCRSVAMSAVVADECGSGCTKVVECGSECGSGCTKVVECGSCRVR